MIVAGDLTGRRVRRRLVPQCQRSEGKLRMAFATRDLRQRRIVIRPLSVRDMRYAKYDFVAIRLYRPLVSKWSK